MSHVVPRHILLHRLLRSAGQLSVGLLLVACTGDDGPPTRDECAAASRHVIALRVAGATVAVEGPDGARMAERHRAQLESAVGGAMAAQCESGMDRATYQCLMAARTSEAADQCGPRPAAEPAQAD